MKMPSYLLLRNNKESGPYNLDDLVKFGLKPYDLVWVEGKSAAWRYPSEVAELKQYAPGVEEQPYDRFFKKNTPEKKEEAVTVVVQEKPAVKEKQLQEAKEKQIQETIALEKKYEKYIPKKSVFVTLPGQKAVSVQKPVVTPEPQPRVQPQVQAEEPVKPVITVTENPAAQIKYSQPLDEIKEMYVKTLQQRKTKIARRSVIISNLKKASVVVGLIAIGVLAGLIIKSGKGDKKGLVQQSVQQPNQSPATDKKEETQQPDEPALSLADQSLIAQNNIGNDQVTTDRTIPVSPEVEQQLQQQQKLQSQKLAKASKDAIVTEKDPVETFDYSLTAGSDPATGERKRIMRGEDNSIPGKATMKPIRTIAKTSLEKQVSVSSNDYKRVAFGGIRNLELTVVNDSKFVLDKVTVELQYLKPNEEPLKTEMIQFHSVSPNGSLTMRVKDTNRGIKVQYKIVDIQSSIPETAMTGF